MSPLPILIVEDEMFLAMDIERILVDAGYTIAGIATDRAEAMASADKAKIAFVDVNLRDGPTGPAIACDLAEKYGVTVVYVTANPTQIDPRAPGAVGVVSKPFRDASILRAASLAVGANDAEDLRPDPNIILFSDRRARG